MKLKGFYKPKIVLFLWLFGTVIISFLVVGAKFFTKRMHIFEFKWISGLVFGVILSVLYGMGLAGWNLYQHNFGKNKNKNKLASSSWIEDDVFRKNFKSFDFSNKNHPNGFIVKTKLQNNNSHFRFWLSDIKGHGLVVGPTFTGKTSLILDPTIRVLGTASIPCSMVISDPKGELFKNHSKWLFKQGYEVSVLNLRDSKNTDYFNPLNIIWQMWKDPQIDNDEALAHLSELTTTLFETTKSFGKDPFFDEAAGDVFQFFVVSFLELSDKDPKKFHQKHFNIHNLLRNMHKMNLSQIKWMVKHELPKESEAIQIGGKHVGSSAEKTIDAVLQTMVNKLKVYNDPFVKKVSCQTTINVTKNKKQVLFLIIPDEKRATYAFVSMFVSEMYKQLVDHAWKTDDNKLDIPFYFLLDEFSNMPKINNMENMISVGRSRQIFFLLFCQSYAQIEEIYGKNTTTTLIANCALEYFLLGNDVQTTSVFSNKLGETSLHLESKNINHGTKPNSTSSSERTRKLAKPDELGKLDFAEIIIKIQRLDPIKTKMAEFLKWKGFEKGALTRKKVEQINFKKEYLKDMVSEEEIRKTKLKNLNQKTKKPLVNQNKLQSKKRREGRNYMAYKATQNQK